MAERGRTRPVPKSKSATRRPMLWASVGGVMVLALAVALALSVTGGSTETGTRVGQAAPNFSLAAAGGGTLELADLRGGRIVLVFFRTYT